MARLILGKALKRKGISKREFAKRLGVEYKNIFRLFKPTADPRLSALNRYAKALGVRVRDLIKE